MTPEELLALEKSYTAAWKGLHEPKYAILRLPTIGCVEIFHNKGVFVNGEAATDEQIKLIQEEIKNGTHRPHLG
jgi:hypothetical protein